MTDEYFLQPVLPNGVITTMNRLIKPVVLQPRAMAVGMAMPLIIFLGGCVVDERPRRTVYVESPAPAAEVVVVDAPPPPREEVIVMRPSPDHFWVRGYWAWRGGRHVWVDGHWELPPHRGAVWVEPRWDHRDRGYVFVSGAWRDGPVIVRENVTVSPSVHVNLNFVAQPPPRPRHEVIVERERPSRDHVWIKGYWVWREGRHVWVNGRWDLPPRHGAVWVEPRWEHRSEGYVFIEGTWR